MSIFVNYYHLALYTAFVQCCFTSTETVQIIRDGEPRTATSSSTQLLTSGYALSSAVACCQIPTLHMVSVPGNMYYRCTALCITSARHCVGWLSRHCVGWLSPVAGSMCCLRPVWCILFMPAIWWSGAMYRSIVNAWHFCVLERVIMHYWCQALCIIGAWYCAMPVLGIVHS